MKDHKPIRLLFFQKTSVLCSVPTTSLIITCWAALLPRPWLLNGACGLPKAPVCCVGGKACTGGGDRAADQLAGDAPGAASCFGFSFLGTLCVGAWQ